MSFESLYWTHENQTAALAAGWGIFENSDHGLQIERHGSRFDCDAAAIAFVGYSAALREPLAVRAFTELAWQHAVSDAAEI